MEDKKIGKIKHVKIGKVGYQDIGWGIDFTFSLEGGSYGCGTSIWFNPHAKSLNKELCFDAYKEIFDLMEDAKIEDMTKFVDIPVEITFEGLTFKSWRILTEVL